MSIPDREAFAAGQLSFWAGLTENPYDPNSDFDEHREWERGFNKAYFINVTKNKSIN